MRWLMQASERLLCTLSQHVHDCEVYINTHHLRQGSMPPARRGRSHSLHCVQAQIIPGVERLQARQRGNGGACKVFHDRAPDVKPLQLSQRAQHLGKQHERVGGKNCGMPSHACLSPGTCTSQVRRCLSRDSHAAIPCMSGGAPKPIIAMEWGMGRTDRFSSSAPTSRGSCSAARPGTSLVR